MSQVGRAELGARLEDSGPLCAVMGRNMWSPSGGEGGGEVPGAQTRGPESTSAETEEFPEAGRQVKRPKRMSGFQFKNSYHSYTSALLVSPNYQ